MLDISASQIVRTSMMFKSFCLWLWGCQTAEAYMPVWGKPLRFWCQLPVIFLVFIPWREKIWKWNMNDCLHSKTRSRHIKRFKRTLIFIMTDTQSAHICIYCDRHTVCTYLYLLWQTHSLYIFVFIVTDTQSAHICIYCDRHTICTYLYLLWQTHSLHIFGVTPSSSYKTKSKQWTTNRI